MRCNIEFKNLFSFKKVFGWLYVALLTFVIFVDKVSASWLGGDTVRCGNIENLPARIPQITASLMNAVMVIIPVLLVIFGVIDLVRGVMAQKEDEIKKGQQTLIKRVIIGMLIFLIVIFAKLIVNLVADNNDIRNSVINCVNCFVNNSCE